MAFREVIDNAVKYSYRDGRIKVTVQESAKGHCAISICNDSLPVRPEEMRRLLERGYRSAEARLRTSEGAGIGLFLVKAVMEAKNGYIALEEHGEQMTGTLELPILMASTVTT
jgi:signal transduction histidine kinase